MCKCGHAAIYPKQSNQIKILLIDKIHIYHAFRLIRLAREMCERYTFRVLLSIEINIYILTSNSFKLFFLCYSCVRVDDIHAQIFACVCYVVFVNQLTQSKFIRIEMRIAEAAKATQMRYLIWFDFHVKWPSHHKILFTSAFICPTILN